ncbi:hypothetical protein B0H11DRAFT_9857 [Mycena galericulata]|nr:hypothetical protein B0H11DRAFT_9857 [Mycena galericulata]
MTKPPSIGDNGVSIPKILKRLVADFDKSIGRALKYICPVPKSLTEEEARSLIAEHSEIIERAYYGTTFSAAVSTWRDAGHRCWRLYGAGLSHLDAENNNRVQSLNVMDSPTNPQEYFRVAMAHRRRNASYQLSRHDTRCLLILVNPVAGYTPSIYIPTIDDFFLKFDSPSRLNSCPTSEPSRSIVPKLSRTPPYLIDIHRPRAVIGPRLADRPLHRRSRQPRPPGLGLPP